MDSRNSGVWQAFGSLVSLFVIFILSLTAFAFMGQFLVSAIFDIDVFTQNTTNLDITKHGDLRTALLVFQLISTGIGAFIFPVLSWKWLIEKDLDSLFESKQFNPILKWGLGLSTIIWVLAFMPFNSALIYFNSTLELPSMFVELENKMKGLEEAAESTTEFLTRFDTHWQFLLGLIVIGIVTGIGEELFFRGAIQYKLTNCIQNPHIGIWATAVIFSFIHFQFYGFLPRLVLGAVFGYIYYWTRNIAYPIIAHITNNSFTICYIYYLQLKGENFDFSDKEMAGWEWVMISMVLSIAILYIIRRKSVVVMKEKFIYEA